MQIFFRVWYFHYCFFWLLKYKPSLVLRPPTVKWSQEFSLSWTVGSGYEINAIPPCGFILAKRWLAKHLIENGLPSQAARSFTAIHSGAPINLNLETEEFLIWQRWIYLQPNKQMYDWNIFNEKKDCLKLIQPNAKSTRELWYLLICRTLLQSERRMHILFRCPGCSLPGIHLGNWMLRF